jgi:asparagine synthase (glutamine-hydrolysing)
MLDEVAVMREAMSARGPDGWGAWASDDGAVGLGHRRLAVIDLSERGSQPMISAEHGLAVVFNGEIYNYSELRSELAAKGYRFRSTSDTEVLLFLYAEYGMALCDRLRGMYAFALYDGKGGELLLARDPFGMKPLYYADDGRVLRFASQVKALLAGGAVDTRPEPAGHVGYYLWGSVPEPYTLFRGIHCLPAGTLLRVGKSRKKTSRTFCSITATLRDAASATVPPGEPAQRLEVLRAALADTVRCHLVADVPVAIFLSAGIDSGCLTALARRVGNADLRTVTVGFSEYIGTAADELPLAQFCARQNATLHTTSIVTREDFQVQLGSFLKSMDQPTLDGFNTYCASKAAAEEGVKVCLSGLGGDELLGGYSTFTEVPRLTCMVGSLLPASLGRVFRWVSARWIGRFTSPKYAGLFELGRTLEGAYLLRRGLFMPWELPAFLPPEMVREGWAELALMSRLSDTREGIIGPRGAISALEMCWYMRNQLLRDSDWAGMAHGVEIRLPLVDMPLLRQVAPYLYSARPFSKSDAAEACGLDWRGRAKSGFSTPIQQWFANEDPAKGFSRGLRGWARYALTQAYGQRRMAIA